MKKILFVCFMFVLNMLIIVGVDTNAFSVDDEYYDMLVKQDLKD